jgi:hypothetical protein
MVLGNEADTKQLLLQLARRLRIEVNEAISEADLTPREELYFHTQIDKFEYGEEGAKVGGRSSRYIVKKTWQSGHLANIIKSVRESSEFDAVANALFRTCADEEPAKVHIWGGLINLVNELARNSLPDSTMSEDDVERFLTVFLKKLQGEPLSYTAEVELTRVVILLPEIEFSANGFESISLRPVTAEDLEQEFPAYKFHIGDVKPYARSGLGGDFALPSAILTFQCIAQQPDKLVERIRQSLAILRLFGTAGVDVVSHRVYSKPHTGHKTFGSLSSAFSGVDRYLGAFGRYQIAEKNANNLIDFWQNLAPKLPEGFRKSGQKKTTDYLTIAYERYCDALLRTGVFEAGIANAVMGLEALLLPDTIEGELGFRLRTHAAKLLGVLGYDSVTVKKAVKSAYTIRSAYVHGGQLSRKSKNRLSRQYTSPKAFSEMILDYLRVIIIAVVMVETGKQDFLTLLDDSLVSERRSKQLVEVLESTRQLLR